MCILWFNFFQCICAQNKNKIPAAFNTIFDDLPVDDPAKNSVLRPGEDSLKKIKENIFVKGAVSKTRCFLGEPILLTYTLFSALQSTSTINRAPSFAGFSVDAMEPDNEQVKRKKQNGKNYRVFIIQQVQLTPLQEGALIIDPVSVYNEVSYKQNDKEFNYGGSAGYKAILINVDPLPVAGRPADFTGATGNFSMQAIADTIAAAGENNTLHIEVTGTGNFTAVSMPDIIWPAGVEHFSVSSHQQMSKNSFQASGKKTFDIPFVAVKEGALIIPAIQLSFFDTQKKTYRVVYSDPIRIRVSPALHKPAPGNTVTPVKKQVPLYYLLPGVLFVLAVIAFVFYRRKRKHAVVIEKLGPEEPALIKEKKEIVGKEQLEALSAFGDKVEYIAAFKKLFIDNLQQQAGFLPGTEEALLQQLQIKDKELGASAGDLFAQCNSLLYAPGAIDAAAKKEMEDKLWAISTRANEIFV